SCKLSQQLSGKASSWPARAGGSLPISCCKCEIVFLLTILVHSPSSLLPPLYAPCCQKRTAKKKGAGKRHLPFSRTPAVTEKKILVRAINDSAIDNGHPGMEAVVKD